MQLIKALKKVPVLSVAIPFAGRLLRTLCNRARILRYPEGNYVNCHGLDIFCDFRHPTHKWYINRSPNLLFDHRLLESLIEQSTGDTFLDIGAHYGFFCASLSSYLGNRPGRIIALEPDRNHFRCLSRTVERCKGPEIITLPYAMSNVDGTAELFDSGADCLHSYRSDNASPSYQVEAICLDSLMAKYRGRTAVVKIDVDGAEPMFFAGGKETIARDRPIIFMEFAPEILISAGNDPQSFFSSLCENHSVYWVRSELNLVSQVSRDDFEKIEFATRNRVTDLVLSSRPLHFPWQES